MLDKHVAREGLMIVKDGDVYLDGWEIAGGGMCREVAAFACLYMAQKLQAHGLALLAKPGGDGRTAIGWPDGTPTDWLSQDTREFLGLVEPQEAKRE